MDERWIEHLTFRTRIIKYLIKYLTECKADALPLSYAPYYW